MVSQGLPPNPAPSMLHHFMISDSINGENQFENQHFDAYESFLRGDNMFQSPGHLPINVREGPNIAQTRHLMDLFGAANEPNYQTQSLSLSLGSTMLVPSVSYRERFLNSDGIGPSYLVSAPEDREVFNAGYSFPGGSLPSSAYGLKSSAEVIENSRFLRPTQSLLEEVVSVGGDHFEDTLGGKLYLGGKTGCLRLSSELKAELCGNEILLLEKQELRVRIAKLISMLEEVEDRYEKYCNQMEQVVSSFEALAGLGAAKSYTAMALQAMSRHFGTLRDAIISQIDRTRRKFSGNLPKINKGLSRLTLVDGEARQNRLSLQQRGLIQSNKQAWRPIRGLPETSAAILRAWLFEHFLHPYPTDSDKLMLSSQTGLTKNQVSNWFINARVRLWKPMIEEMYREEFADSPEESNQSPASNSMAGEGNTDDAED